MRLQIPVHIPAFNSFGHLPGSGIGLFGDPMFNLFQELPYYLTLFNFFMEFCGYPILVMIINNLVSWL